MCVKPFFPPNLRVLLSLPATYPSYQRTGVLKICLGGDYPVRGLILGAFDFFLIKPLHLN